MSKYRLRTAYLGTGWAHDVHVSVSDAGMITALGEAAIGDAELIDGIVVPGMPNGHSHAFQRAMAGNAEYRTSAHDSFWTWRQAMYALANRIEPEELETIATQLFIEMLQAGYTSVAEFHYLHRQRSGAGYADDNELWAAVSRAAATSGIGLTLLPTLYQTSNFAGAALKPEQARFAMSTDEFLRSLETYARALDGNDSAGASHLGVAFHSLRAVPLATLLDVAAAVHRIDAGMPIHIHVSEQLLEVDDCIAATGMRPVELLLDSGLLDARWCLVHATHATPAELQGIARSGASVCVSVTTEANLGDGFFDTTRYLEAGGALCVGSDSQSTVSPCEELRWLEYQQRLLNRRRGVLASTAQVHVGTRLWADAAAAGARAIGQPVGSIEVGRRADWLVLDPQHPSMAGASTDAALDHLLFAGGQAAIHDVMVAGRWCIRDGGHAAEAGLCDRFYALLKSLC